MNNKFAQLLLTLAMATLLSACGSLPTKSEDIISHTVAAGEGLGDIAKLHTGSAFNWQKIADFNGIDDPKKLKAGRVLLIPIALIRDNVDISQASAKKKPETAKPFKADVKVEPADIDREFELNPLSKPESNLAANGVTMIRVAGSYFPKVIYRRPRVTSALMQRVAPGEVFELKDEVGEWYKIQTDNGIGYIRTIDALIAE